MPALSATAPSTPPAAESDARLASTAGRSRAPGDEHEPAPERGGGADGGGAAVAHVLHGLAHRREGENASRLSAAVSRDAPAQSRRCGGRAEASRARRAFCFLFFFKSATSSVGVCPLSSAVCPRVCGLCGLCGICGLCCTQRVSEFLREHVLDRGDGGPPTNAARASRRRHAAARASCRPSDASFTRSDATTTLQSIGSSSVRPFPNAIRKRRRPWRSARPAPGPPRTPARRRAATRRAGGPSSSASASITTSRSTASAASPSPSRLAQTHAVAPAIASRAARERDESASGDVAETNNACAASAADASPDAFDEDAVPSEEVPSSSDASPERDASLVDAPEESIVRKRARPCFTGRSQGARPASSRRRRAPGTTTPRATDLKGPRGKARSLRVDEKCFQRFSPKARRAATLRNAHGKVLRATMLAWMHFT